MTITRTVATGAPALFEVTSNPLAVLGVGVLGERKPLATTSGVEAVSCAHSLIATG